jgi:two-component system NtrC family response regulator
MNPRQLNVDPVIGESDVIRRVRDWAAKIGPSNVKVLITGESGVGKDVFSRYLHAQSGRATRPFVAVNCAGVTETLLESELFGHVKGSFTGAYRDKVGRLQLADRGTIFLDEVGEMSPRMQALLLRFLENGEIHPVGSDTSLAHVDVRVIAATNRDLDEMVRSGGFRLDLLYRIRVAHLHIPPLRERREDIPLLVRHFVAKLGHELRFSDEAMKALQRYSWPGNIRELQSLVEHLVLLTDAAVTLDDLPLELQQREKSASRVDDRRPERGDQLYDQLLDGGFDFWSDVHALFLNRDLTRHDLRQLIRRGLRTTCGSYRGLLPLFGMPGEDYKRFLNFLATHDCMPNFREFRSGIAADHGGGRVRRSEPRHDQQL